jgi:Tol biopolymer transport system component
MRELNDRFRSLDRIAAPDLWNEVVSRSAALALVPRRRVSRTWVLIAAAVLLAALAGALTLGSWLIRPTPDHSRAQYANGMIIGVRGCELVGMDPMTGESRVLVAGPQGCSPGEHLRVPTALSSDGRLLAYVISRYCGACFEEPSKEAVEGQGAWIYDTRTGATRQLEPCPERYCEEVDISPDGSLVAYTARSDPVEPGALIVVDVKPAGSSHRIDLPAVPGKPAFSPDGHQIVFALKDGPPGLWSIDLAGIATLPPSQVPVPTLLYRDGVAANPVWSPDGAWIAFQAPSVNHEVGLWIVRPDGTDARTLATGPEDELPGFAAWSPDGRRIAYVRTSSIIELWTVTIDGGKATRIYGSWCCVTDYSPPVWSPDGQWIAFGMRARNVGTARVHPDGTGLWFITTDVMQPAWQPIPIASPAR